MSARRLIIVTLLLLAIAAVVGARSRRETPARESQTLTIRSLPRLVDLGAGKCIPCKAMAPILDELRRDYSNTFEVVFIDAWENPSAADPYNIELIPTQIFLDANGGELWRHEGFLARDDILAKWSELGVTL